MKKELNVETMKDLIAKITSSEINMKILARECPHNYGYVDYCTMNGNSSDDILLHCCKCWKKSLKDAKNNEK